VYNRGHAGNRLLAVDARLDRVSRNEAVYRAVNREIERASEEMGEGPHDRLEVVCECGEDSCSETLDVTVQEYDAAHSQRDRFVVAPGHEDEQIEHVVKRTDRYLVVDKFGEAERIAEQQERRDGVD